ncbi:hypothetical protein ACFQZU_13050 [Streptomonospora algeriensis]|uniref:DUF3618 domain-containing protein n=1 Tax=Streptomonospora algeriensis TaxID=995084 RepID=A0ABW3BH98_9ACTN
MAETADQARSTAGEVGSTAKEHAEGLVGDARTQAGHVAEDVQSRIMSEAHSQSQRFGENLRQWSSELESMAEHGEEGSPVQQVVRQAAQGGHGAADYLDERGVDGLLEEAKDFARRRPVAFLVGAAVAGFTVGRVLKASSAEPQQAASGSGGQGSASGQPAPPAPRQGGATLGETASRAEEGRT